MTIIADRAQQALNKLAKWRSILAGWHLGTADREGPGVMAMRDLREAVLIHRVELNALSALLLKKGILTEDDLAKATAEEAELMDQDMARRFPGFRSVSNGIEVYDPDLAAQTTKRLGFPL